MSGAITAVGAAVAAATVTEVFTAVAVTGAVLGAVGAATGVKPLMYAGMAMGLVGGVGAFATSAGILGAEAGLEGFGPEAMDGATAAEGGVLSEGGGGFAGTLDTITPAAPVMDLQGQPITYASEMAQASAPTDIIDSITGSMQPIDAASSPIVQNASAPDVLPRAATDSVSIPQGDQQFNAPWESLNRPPDGTDTLLAEQRAVTPAGGGAAAPPPAPESPAPAAPDLSTARPGTPGAFATDPTQGGIAGQGGAAARGQVSLPGATPVTNVPVPADPASSWEGILKFATSPGGGLLGLGVIQAGASFLSGATSTLTPAQVELYKAQAANNLAAANLANAQRDNLGQPLPVASRPGASPPVTGAPAGLINSQPRAA